MINVFDDIAFQYGKLLKIDSQALVERYNRALFALIEKRTSLKEFHIDCTGFSPEIALELDNDDYLNAHGVNKKFILISMKQVDMDMAKTHFSSTMHMVKSFCRDNKKALTTLTAGDVVFGELDNKQFKANSVSDMLKANTVYITVDTSKKLLEKSTSCADKVELLLEGDNWQDDALLGDIIELSKTCGNVLKNGAIPSKLNYQRGHYYTTLFGGMYVFQMEEGITLITEDPLFNGNQEGLENVEVISQHSEKKVYAFLEKHNFIEPMSFNYLQEKLSEFELKLLHSAMDGYLKSKGVKSFAYMDKNAIKNYIVENYDHLPNDFYRIERLVNALQNNLPDSIKVKEYKPYFWRASSDLSGADFSLVSRLLCNFKSYSYFSMFVHNRKLFETKYKRWSEAKQDYVRTHLFDHSSIITNMRKRIDVE